MYDMAVETYRGYLVVNEVTGEGYVCSDAVGVANLLEVHRNTVVGWFQGGVLLARRSPYLVVRGYEVVKSNRGGGSGWKK